MNPLDGLLLVYLDHLDGPLLVHLDHLDTMRLVLFRVGDLSVVEHFRSFQVLLHIPKATEC